MTKVFQFVIIAWRIWRAHKTKTFCRLMWYYLKAHLTGEWEPWLWACVPSTGRVAIDGGANTGQWTRKLATRFQEVIAIEPHPKTVRHLRATAPFNARVLEGAIWNCSEWKTLILYPDLRVCRISEHDFLYSMGKGTNGVEVPCFPIDALRLTNVDFIKLDVEGAEAEALEGAVETINASRPVLLIELHSTKARERIKRLLTLFEYTWEYRHFPIYSPQDDLYNDRLWMVAKRKE